jgi:hypothetical protein
MLAFTTDVGYPALIYTPSYIVRASSGTLKATQLVNNIIENSCTKGEYAEPVIECLFYVNMYILSDFL